MRSASILSLAVFSLVSAAPATAADAISYSGTIGTIPVILELSSTPGEGDVAAGRYAYLSKGVDIPLKGVPSGSAELRFEEEAPCTVALCGSPQDGADLKTVVGAEWKLTAKNDGATLEGTWRDTKSGKSLKVALERKGWRVVDLDAYSPLEALDPTYATMGFVGPFTMTADEYSYEFLKMDWPFDEGAEVEVGDGTVRMGTDKRVSLAYPVVVSLGDADVAPVNAYLFQQRLQNALPSFSCLSSAYLGYGWNNTDGQGTNGYDGGMSVTVDHLSPRLISLTESGSYWCGGAHPSNFSTHRMAKVETGEPIIPESLLAGWVATDEAGKTYDPAVVEDPDGLTFGPDAELVAYVRANRTKFDAETETDCGIDDLVASNLGVTVKGDDLVFTLKGLPHVIFACTNDLLTVPLRDARPLLNETGAAYFAVLDE